MKIKLLDYGYRKIPRRMHHNDTGADVYLLDDIKIEPGETKIIPIGFGLEIPNGYNAHFQARTSIAKRGVYVHQCAIDAGYRGELHIIVTNMSKDTQYFEFGERICYIEIMSCVYADFVENFEDERDDAAFGSTGK